MNRQELASMIERASFKQVLFFCGLLPALFSFPIAYLVSPTAQQNLTNIPITVMVFLAWMCMWLVMLSCGAWIFRDYVVYSPRVYNRISDESYLILAKSKFFKELLDLFVETTENKLKATWNKQTMKVEQNTEDITGLKTMIASLEGKIKELEANKKIEFDQFARGNRERFDIKWRIMKLETKVDDIKKEIDSITKSGEPVPLIDFERITRMLLEIQTEIRLIKGE
ncbi:MAG TPA: hypothetical protein VFM64_02415 [Candidatus Nitrosotenuis sp.]|nr:hypothetical protein [Candidatus Nitrosotenuis sp.]